MISSDTVERFVKGNPRSSGYARSENNWYVEPIGAVYALLEKEEFIGGIHDPSCGCGTIPIACNSWGYESTGADLVDRGYGVVKDFLSDTDTYDNIVCNPPFGIATDFVVHALNHLSSPTGKVCMLQRLAWLEGKSRHDTIFSKGYLHKVWTFINRISMPPGGKNIEPKGGSIAFAWFVFGNTPKSFYEGGWVTSH